MYLLESFVCFSFVFWFSVCVVWVYLSKFEKVLFAKSLILLPFPFFGLLFRITSKAYQMHSFPNNCSFVVSPVTLNAYLLLPSQYNIFSAQNLYSILFRCLIFVYTGLVFTVEINKLAQGYERYREWTWVYVYARENTRKNFFYLICSWYSCK